MNRSGPSAPAVIYQCTDARPMAEADPHADGAMYVRNVLE